jgi:hypothetical protein
MPTTVEFGHDPEILAGFEAAIVQNAGAEDVDLIAEAAAYQEIADRRSQLENADVLRRARSL